MLCEHGFTRLLLASLGSPLPAAFGGASRAELSRNIHVLACDSGLDVAAQVEIESKIETQLKAI